MNKHWLIDNIDSAPPSLANRMHALLYIISRNPSYSPPIALFQAELARYQARSARQPASLQSSASPCPPHATWCPRFGLPTGPHACEVCTAERASKDQYTATDDEGEFTTPWSAYFLSQMRYIGQFYGAVTCTHRQPTGRTIEQRCCGGKTKQIPVYTCALTNQDADCLHCPRKTPANDVTA